MEMVVKILAVDDDRNFLKMIAESLYSFKFDVAISSNYEDAMTSLESFDPDVALLDYLMKGDKRTGVDLAHDMKKIKPTIKLVLITGLLIREQYDEETLFIKTFKKPINTENLSEYLTSVEKSF